MVTHFSWHPTWGWSHVARLNLKKISQGWLVCLPSSETAPVEVTLGNPWPFMNMEPPTPGHSLTTSREIISLGGGIIKGGYLGLPKALIPNHPFALSYHLHFPFGARPWVQVFRENLVEYWLSLAEATLLRDLKFPSWIL